jgi:hypothetical protein
MNDSLSQMPNFMAKASDEGLYTLTRAYSELGARRGLAAIIGSAPPPAEGTVAHEARNSAETRINPNNAQRFLIITSDLSMARLSRADDARPR